MRTEALLTTSTQSEGVVRPYFRVLGIKEGQSVAHGSSQKTWRESHHNRTCSKRYGLPTLTPYIDTRIFRTMQTGVNRYNGQRIDLLLCLYVGLSRPALVPTQSGKEETRTLA
jgi:hypothetical protein